MNDYTRTGSRFAVHMYMKDLLYICNVRTWSFIINDSTQVHSLQPSALSVRSSDPSAAPGNRKQINFILYFKAH